MTPLHGIASRHDLPLPFELVLAGAAAVLLITFWVVFFAWREPRYEEGGGRPLPRLTTLVNSRTFDVLSRGLVAALWLLALVALVFGVDRIDNPVVGFVYVLVWVGLVVVGVLLGDVYRRTNPVRLLLLGRGTREADSLAGRWPGALALALFLYLELVVPGGVTLPVLRVGAAVWLAWVIVGALVRADWVERAEPFEVYSTTVSHLSPWRKQGGVIHLVNPLRNLASWAPPRNSWAIAVVLLGGTAFDAMSNTAWWQRMIQVSSTPDWAYGTVGLAGMIVLVGMFYAFGARFLDDGSGLFGTMDRLSPGLVPLVVGYCFAHYGTYLYLEGQRTLIRFNDPLGTGQNWFGFGETAPDVSLLAFPTAVAWAQVILIVGGHVLGVLVTHDVALRKPAGRILTRQLPLLLVMVGFTVGGLLLMFGS